MRNVFADARAFRVLENADNLQTAVMALEPGEESGPLGNEHGSSEQVLLVVEGSLDAEIDGKHFTMSPGDSVVVRKNEAHRFVNRSAKRALTFNVYAPKAY